jgi:hypothetical protein
MLVYVDSLVVYACMFIDVGSLVVNVCMPVDVGSLVVFACMLVDVGSLVVYICMLVDSRRTACRAAAGRGVGSLCVSTVGGEVLLPRVRVDGCLSPLLMAVSALC